MREVTNGRGVLIKRCAFKYIILVCFATCLITFMSFWYFQVHFWWKAARQGRGVTEAKEDQSNTDLKEKPKDSFLRRNMNICELNTPRWPKWRIKFQLILRKVRNGGVAFHPINFVWDPVEECFWSRGPLGVVLSPGGGGSGGHVRR